MVTEKERETTQREREKKKKKKKERPQLHACIVCGERCTHGSIYQANLHIERENEQTVAATLDGRTLRLKALRRPEKVRWKESRQERWPYIRVSSL